MIPKPIQKPHPPVWVACSRQETIVMAARLGLGAVTFGFLSPVDAQQWTEDYYATMASDCTSDHVPGQPQRRISFHVRMRPR